MEISFFVNPKQPQAQGRPKKVRLLICDFGHTALGWGYGLESLCKKSKDELYDGDIVFYRENADEATFLSAGAYAGKDTMEISVHGSDERILLTARFDNLGKGASGAAVECMNLVLGDEPGKGLVLN